MKESIPMDADLALDTNIVIGPFRGDKKILVKLESDPDIHIPIIVIGESLYGAEKSENKRENKNRIQEFAGLNNILEIDNTTA